MCIRLIDLCAAYYTIMMRAASDAGQGLTLDTSIDTVLVFMVRLTAHVSRLITSLSRNMEWKGTDRPKMVVL